VVYVGTHCMNPISFFVPLFQFIDLSLVLLVSLA